MAWFCERRSRREQSIPIVSMFMADKTNAEQADIVAVATAEGLLSD